MSLAERSDPPPSIRVSAGARSIGGALRTQARVIGALVIRDMHTRFGGSLVSYALAVAWPGGPGLVVEGRIDGTLAWPPRGDRGFGYDPIFQPDGFTQTFGELDPAAKDAMSHRARAFTKLKAALL